MAAKRKTRRRRNSGGSFMVLNPRRKARRKTTRRKTRRANPSYAFNAPRRRRSTRRRRNPAAFVGRGGANILGIPFGGAVGIVGGALAVKAIGNLVGRFLPFPEGPLKKYGTQAVATIGATFLARRFMGRGAASAVAQGGAVAIVMGAVNEYVAPRVPLLAEYEFGGGAGTLMEYLPGGERAVREVPMLSDGSMWQASF